MKNICFYPLHSAPSSEEEYVTLESQADRDLSLPDIWEPVASQSRRRGLLILTGKISIIEIPYGDRMANSMYYTMALRHARGTSAWMLLLVLELMHLDIDRMASGTEKQQRLFELLQDVRMYYENFLPNLLRK